MLCCVCRWMFGAHVLPHMASRLWLASNAEHGSQQRDATRVLEHRIEHRETGDVSSVREVWLCHQAGMGRKFSLTRRYGSSAHVLE